MRLAMSLSSVHLHAGRGKGISDKQNSRTAILGMPPSSTSWLREENPAALVKQRSANLGTQTRVPGVSL